MTAKKRIVVVGAGGIQARSFLKLVQRHGPAELEIIAVDRRWTEAGRLECASEGLEPVSLDILQDGEQFERLCKPAELIVNLAGPFFLLGPIAIETAIRCGAHYLDICDDADATVRLLEYDSRAREAGVCGAIGMGASPGTTNLLARLAFDAMGRPAGARADIGWTVPCDQLSPTAFIHVLHGFSTALDLGGGVPEWENLEPELVEFPGEMGQVRLVRLGHPEPVTLPRFLGIATVNKGGLTPSDMLPLCWSLARIREQLSNGTDESVLFDLFVKQLNLLPPRPEWRESGMRIDVTAAGAGYRFISSTTMPVDLSTAVPAAAGTILLLEGYMPRTGVVAPECFSPSRFFDTAHRISPKGGALKAYRLVDGEPTERVRISELLRQAGTMRYAA